MAFFYANFTVITIILTAIVILFNIEYHHSSRYLKPTQLDYFFTTGDLVMFGWLLLPSANYLVALAFLLAGISQIYCRLLKKKPNI